jgi:glycosyltransferase involved in cell wall biosynthesis
LRSNQKGGNLSERSSGLERKQELAVSVIICCYNAEKYLRNAIASIQAQIYPNIEILIIDDASKDATPQIVKEAAASDRRIKYICLEINGGIARVRQRGLEVASHDWVVFVDADDVIMPEMIEYQVSVLRTDPHLIGVGTYSYYIDDAGPVRGIQSLGPLSREHFFELFRKAKMFFLLPNTLFSRRDALAVGGYRVEGFWNEPGKRMQDYCEDVDLWCRLSDLGAQGKYLVTIPKPLFYYRKRTDSLSSRNIFLMTRKMRWIKDCLVRRRAGGFEISLAEYERSLTLWRRLNNLRTDYAAYLYRKAAFQYTKRNLLMTALLLPLPILLSPAYILQKFKSQKLVQ